VTKLEPFHPILWISLTEALLRILAFVDGKVGLALARINQDLRDGRLEVGRVVLGATMIAPIEASDWERLTVCAPLLNPAEGVRVDPYEPGHYFVRRAGLDRHYPTAAMMAAMPPPGPTPAGRAETEATRWARDPVIARMKVYWPPHGLRPPGYSIAKLTIRLNKEPEFLDKNVSEDTVRLADKEIKAALEK
jgi:hypothetical protein